MEEYDKDRTLMIEHTLRHVKTREIRNILEGGLGKKRVKRVFTQDNERYDEIWDFWRSEVLAWDSHLEVGGCIKLVLINIRR